MKRTISHRDREKPCEFLERDQRGHWQCRLLQFSGQPVAIITPRGRLEWVTSSAQDILQRYWPNRPVLETRLPVQIRTWMHKAQKRPGMRKDVAQEPSPLVIHQPPGRLVVRMMHDGTFTALLFEELLSDLPADRLAALGLTPREAEVLRWLAQGKSSPEIATILGVSSRTVSKHLTRVYQQLGVEIGMLPSQQPWTQCGHARAAMTRASRVIKFLLFSSLSFSNHAAHDEIRHSLEHLSCEPVIVPSHC